MPLHFFSGALEIYYATALRANTAAQDFSVCPRHWYIDARFRCGSCGAEFIWSADEQKVWFENYHFYVDSKPTLCRDCRLRRRDAIALRKEYDAIVGEARSSDSLEDKHRAVEIVDELERYWNCVPKKMRETREIFRNQIKKDERHA